MKVLVRSQLLHVVNFSPRLVRGGLLGLLGVLLYVYEPSLPTSSHFSVHCTAFLHPRVFIFTSDTSNITDVLKLLALLLTGHILAPGALPTPSDAGQAPEAWT